MKKLIAHILTLSLVISMPLSGQGLVTGNSDVVELSGYPYFSQLIKAGPESFFWVASTYLNSADHPLLTDVVAEYPHIYFLNYDAAGDARSANFIRGSYLPLDAFSHAGGLNIYGISYQDVESSTGAVVPINNAYKVAFLAGFNEKCQFVKMVPVLYFSESQYENPRAAMDRSDGSIYLAGTASEPLNVFGHGLIGSGLEEYLYVLKFDQNLNLGDVFIAGMEAEGEYGFYGNELVLIPDHRGAVVISGTWEGDRTPIIGGDTLRGLGFESQGVFAFQLGAGLGVEWIRDGSLDGFDYGGTSMIHEGFFMRNGDLVMVGGTSTGYFRLGQVEVVLENGSGFYNHFAFRVSPEGAARWVQDYMTMDEAYNEGKKAAQATSRPRESHSDQFTESMDWDALHWNEEILYMTGTFLSDTFRVAGRELEKPHYSGLFVAATDMNTGKEKWGYAVSSSYTGLHGFDVDAGGNPSVMGYSGYLKHYEFIGGDSVSGGQPIFHLGLSFEGKPLWTNNATIQGQSYGGYGADLLVLRDGEVFSSTYKSVAGNLEIGGIPVAASTNYASFLVALDVGNLLGGTLLTSESIAVNSGQIKAYKRTASGAYPMVDSIPVGADGSYEFEGLYPGSYILLATPNRNAYPDAVPTYSGGAVAWDDAKTNLVRIDVDTRFSSNFINLASLPPLTPEDGSGQMGGNVSYEDEPDLGKGTLGKPATKTSVVLKRRAAQQQKTAMADDIVAYVETDDQGNYVFENVPDGDYVLHVDIAGLPMVQTYDVVIVGNKIVYGLDFVVKKNGIEATNPVAVEGISRKRFAAYPNPASRILHIDFPGAGAYELRVFNTAGAQVLFRDLPVVPGTVMLDVSTWERGAYLIRIEGNGKRETVKFIRQ